jgi:branched-chain amino acid transport system permease protein
VSVQKRAGGLWVVSASAVVLILVLPLLLPGYFLYVVTLGAIWAIAAVGLNVLTGYAGQISIGHAGFMGIGAYTSALLTLDARWPFWLAFPAAVVTTTLAGWVLGIPALRLSGPYLAIATLGFGTAVPQILVKWEPMTGGYMGLKPPKPTIGTYTLASDTAAFYLAAGVLLVMSLAAVNLVRSPVGRAFVALRDNEAAAQASGINVARYKVLAFATSALYAGASGALYAHLVGFISPSDFNLLVSIFLISAIVIGGLASIPGAIAGGLVLTVGLHLLGAFRDLRQVAYGLALVAMVIFFPGGLVRAGGRLLHVRRVAAEIIRVRGVRSEVDHAEP